MKLFIDSAKITEIQQVLNWGVLGGVTTNPSLIKDAFEEERTKGTMTNLSQYLTTLLTACRGLPVSLEVASTTYEGMVAEGRTLYKQFNRVAKNVLVKIPISPSTAPNDSVVMDGLRAIKTLSGEGIPINCTLIFTPEQALLAARAGAKIVSPFAGRVDDYIRTQKKIKFQKKDYFPPDGMTKKGVVLDDNGIVSGIDLVTQIVALFHLHDIKTEVLAASIRNPRQFREAALSGAQIATVPFEVIKELVQHPKSREGVKKFAEDTIMDYRSLLSGAK